MVERDEGKQCKQHATKIRKQDVAHRARARRYRSDTASVKTTKSKQHRERPHIVLQQSWEPQQGGGPSKLAPLDIS